MDKEIRIKELVELLNKASNAYYNSDKPIMSDYEFDKLYDELKQLEKETGIIYQTSPTQRVGYMVVSERKKVKHDHPMLSLDKCHSIEEIKKFCCDQVVYASVKCDGLTTSLTYENGVLVKAETRGDGVIGEDVLSNVLTITNIPFTIPTQEKIVVDGEVVITYEDFRKINNTLPEKERYEHCRNLAAGSLRIFDSKIAAKRNMKFIAWKLVDGYAINDYHARMLLLEELGFTISPGKLITQKNIKEIVLNEFKSMSKEEDIPMDGIVFTYNDILYGNSLGMTGKFPRGSIAYKYEDEKFETILRDVIWQVSRTGVLNPVAVFDPVNLDGGNTTRATLHNLTIVKDFKLGIGDKILVYRANQVIPRVDENLTRSNTLILPKICPVCGEPLIIKQSDKCENLYCVNPNCSSKNISKLINFCGKTGMDIKGLSEETLTKFYDLGFVNSYIDIYNLEKKYKNKIINMPGFGIKSANKLFKAIEDSKNTTLDKFLCALSIPMLGKENCKLIAKKFNNNWAKFQEALESHYVFSNLNNIGDTINNSIYVWYKDCFKEDNIDKLIPILNFSVSSTETSNFLAGKTFCITGKFSLFKNREEIKEYIETNGGKVTGSVSAKTSYLINNDINSSSSKNKAAKELDIPIITEEMLKKIVANS